jgi:hypothetical protein
MKIASLSFAIFAVSPEISFSFLKFPHLHVPVIKFFLISGFYPNALIHLVFFSSASPAGESTFTRIN